MQPVPSTQSTVSSRRVKYVYMNQRTKEQAFNRRLLQLSYAAALTERLWQGLAILLLIVTFLTPLAHSLIQNHAN